MSTGLARADPVPRIISWLDTHPDVVAVLGGSGRVRADNVPPYPMVRITDPPGGDDGILRRLVSQVIQVEAYGDLDGSTSKGDLKAIMYTVLGAMAEIPDQPVPQGMAVITHIGSLLGAGWQPEPTGQPRYLAQVRVWCHAGRA